MAQHRAGSGDVGMGVEKPHQLREHVGRQNRVVIQYRDAAATGAAQRHVIVLREASDTAHRVDDQRRMRPHDLPQRGRVVVVRHEVHLVAYAAREPPDRSEALPHQVRPGALISSQ